MGSSSQLLAESWPPLSVPLQLQLSVRFAASDSTLISPALPSVSCKICNTFAVSLSRGNRARDSDGAEVEQTRRELHHGPCRHLHSHYRSFTTECRAVRTSSPAAIKLSLHRKLTDQSDDCLTQQLFWIQHGDVIRVISCAPFVWKSCVYACIPAAVVCIFNGLRWWGAAFPEPQSWKRSPPLTSNHILPHAITPHSLCKVKIIDLIDM